jgi:hypothetical protein
VSDIVTSTINENFPVAGQDNDTQVFRDNFNSIKTALSTARRDEESDFNYNAVYRAVIQGAWERKREYGSVNSATQEFSLLQGHYHTIKFTGNSTLSFKEFPTNTGSNVNQGVGKITLEIYGDGTARTLTFSVEGATEFRKNVSASWGGTALNPTITVTSDTNPVFVEVWQHNSDVVFLNYLGQFS